MANPPEVDDKMTTDMFGERLITIPCNSYLADIANHILDLTKRDPLLLTGASIGEINRKVTLAVWEDSGLTPLVFAGGREAFRKWFMNAKVNQEEEVARALRWLSANDHVRLPTKAIQNAEQHRQRIARSVRS
jgi:hypothetical protein